MRSWRRATLAAAAWFPETKVGPCHRGHLIIQQQQWYAVRVLASEVLPSLVGSMQTINDTLRIQSRIMNDRLKFHHGSADPVQGDAKLRENSGDEDATENHANGGRDE